MIKNKKEKDERLMDEMKELYRQCKKDEEVKERLIIEITQKMEKLSENVLEISTENEKEKKEKIEINSLLRKMESERNWLNAKLIEMNGREKGTADEIISLKEEKNK